MSARTCHSNSYERLAVPKLLTVRLDVEGPPRMTNRTTLPFRDRGHDDYDSSISLPIRPTIGERRRQTIPKISLPPPCPPRNLIAVRGSLDTIRGHHGSDRLQRERIQLPERAKSRRPHNDDKGLFKAFRRGQHNKQRRYRRRNALPPLTEESEPPSAPPVRPVHVPNGTAISPTKTRDNSVVLERPQQSSRPPFEAVLVAPRKASKQQQVAEWVDKQKPQSATAPIRGVCPPRATSMDLERRQRSRRRNVWSVAIYSLAMTILLVTVVVAVAIASSASRL